MKLKDIDIISRFKNDYETIRNIVFAWQDGSYIPDPLDTPCDIINAAREMYSRMYAEDNTITCDPQDLKQDFDNTVLILQTMKQQHATNSQLGSCIKDLEYTINEIISMMGIENVVLGTESGNEQDKLSMYNLILADCSFRALFHVFDTEILGSPVLGDVTNVETQASESWF